RIHVRDPLKGRREVPRFLVAKGRLLRERLQNDRVELARKRRPEMARRDGLPDDVIPEKDGGVGAREGRFADEAFVKDETQTVDVGLDGRALPLDPLRSDVHRGRVELRRVRVLLGITCDTEVTDLRRVVRVEEDVGWLQV